MSKDKDTYNQLDWVKDVHIGKEYKYEEKYHFQVHVLVLEKKFDEDKDFIEFLLEITKTFGQGDVGGSFFASKTLDKKYSYLMSGTKFKELDALFSYGMPSGCE